MKLLVGQIAVVFGIIIFAIWISTHGAARCVAVSRLVCQTRLVADAQAVELFEWWHYPDAYAPSFRPSDGLAGASGYLGVRQRTQARSGA